MTHTHPPTTTTHTHTQMQSKEMRMIGGDVGLSHQRPLTFTKGFHTCTRKNPSSATPKDIFHCSHNYSSRKLGLFPEDKEHTTFNIYEFISKELSYWEVRSQVGKQVS